MVDLTIRPFKADTPNHKVLNAIRHEASPEYQARIPVATQANIQDTINRLQQYSPSWNEFVAAIINKVGLTIARNNNWTNPMAKFKRGMLQFGDTIEEIQTGLVQAYVYDFDREYGEQALFGKERPEVQADYHKVNRENFYKITVHRVALQRAFQSETGLASFINQLMEAPTTSDNWDEYLVMRQLFKHYEDNGGFFKVHVPEIPDTESASVEARQALRAIRTYMGKLPFLSREYNAAHMPVHAENADFELFVTPEFQAALDVEALAPLLNVSYAEINSRITVIDQFPDGMEDIKAILTTRDFFVVADTYYDTTQQQNAAGLYENYFLHHHQIVSVSRFVPAIAFTTGPGTATTKIETPVTGISEVEVIDRTGAVVTTVNRGESYEVIGSAVTAPEGGVNAAVRFQLVGNLSSRSYVTNTGVLHVSPYDAAATLTIRVTSVDLPDFTRDEVLTVTGDRLILWPNAEVIEDDDNDGIGEVEPVAPEQNGDVVTIPNARGVQYKIGATNVKNGTEHDVPPAGLTVDAAPRSGYEFAAGSTVSWTYNPTSS